MKVIQSHPNFYIEISYDMIKICTRSDVSLYPVWLGKNRAIMRDVIKYLMQNPPENIIDCMDMVGKFGLFGQGSNEKPVMEIFAKDDKSLDNEKTFW